MDLKWFECLCIGLCLVGVRCQKSWGPNSDYNSGYSNSWNSGFPGDNFQNSGSIVQSGFENVFRNSFSNKQSSTGGGSEGSWAVSSLNSNKGSNEGLYSPENEKSNWGYETSSNKAPKKPNAGNSVNWHSDMFNMRPNEKMSDYKTDSPSSSKWNTNSDNFPSSGNNKAASWDSLRPFSANKDQNLNPGVWNSNTLSSNNLNNKGNNNENEIITDNNYEDNSMISMWNSNNKKKTKPISNSYTGSGKWETTTERRNKNTGAPKWESNYYQKPPKPSKNNNPNIPLKPNNNKPPTNANQQNVKGSSTPDTSILDELDKNDWYFGKESDYPNPPFRSTLNIDVSELWNFDKNKKKINQNSRGSGNNSNNKRRNRQIVRSGDVTKGFPCECVNVNSCAEEDMIITQEDIKFDMRPLEDFICKDLTEVCCTNPNSWMYNRTNFSEEKVTLRCGQNRISEKNRIQKLRERLDPSENVAEPGEFPWMLTLENAKDSCSATLIHHKLALTAAHCTRGALPNELVLKAGVWNSNSELSQIRRVTRIIPHPDYNSQTPRNDIALLVVEEPFELTENVNPICLPITNDKWESNQCVVAGWKKEISGQVLEKGTVNFLAQAECQNILMVTDLWRNYVLHDSFVCGLEKTGRQSCLGEEGGFVICPSKKQADTYLQIGIISKGMNCDNFGRPGIFTNVLKFLDWINRNYFELGLFDDIDIRSLA